MTFVKVCTFDGSWETRNVVTNTGHQLGLQPSHLGHTQAEWQSCPRVMGSYISYPYTVLQLCWPGKELLFPRFLRDRAKVILSLEDAFCASYKHVVWHTLTGCVVQSTSRSCPLKVEFREIRNRCHLTVIYLHIPYRICSTYVDQYHCALRQEWELQNRIALVQYF